METGAVSVATERAGRPARLRGGLTRAAIERALPALSAGRLTLILPNGETIVREGDVSGPEAELVVKRWPALARILANGDHGFAEGYLRGEWSTPDLRALLQLFMANEAAFGRQGEPSRIGNAVNRLAHTLRKNTRTGSRRNIAAHYDLGNAFYREWLDTGMNYSSALYRHDETLETAQQAKLDRICDLLDLGGGERVLEIGCGWGALAERIVRERGASLSGITLSQEQLAYARQRLAAEVADGCADLRLQDYRDLSGRYDRIASVEMIEAVGERFWPTYFDTLHKVLAPGGVAVLQAITIAEHRFAAYRRRPDFIQRYIFPGGLLPTIERIEAEAARAGLALVHCEGFGASYARTLEVWRRRFLAAWDRIEPLGFDARFRRMWEYYLTYCEVGFQAGAVDVNLFKLARRSNASPS